MSSMKVLCDDFTPDIIKQAEEELGETVEVREECLKELKKLIEKEPDFNPCMDDSFLLRFLRTRKFDVQRAFKTLTNYYKFKIRYSGIVTDLQPSDVKSILELEYGTCLEYRDEDKSPIIYIRLGKFGSTKYGPMDVMACGLVCGEVIFQSEASQVTGYTVILDLTDFNLRLAAQFSSPSFLYTNMLLLQDCLPCRLKAFHFVNGPSYCNVVFKFLRMILSSKLKTRVHVHGNDLKSLHQSISPELLPEELGGNQGPITKFAKVFISKILSYEDYFIDFNKHGYVGETLQQLTKNNSKKIAS